MTRFVLRVAFGLTLAIALLLTVGACAESSQTLNRPPTSASANSQRTLARRHHAAYYGVRRRWSETIAWADVIGLGWPLRISDRGGGTGGGDRRTTVARRKALPRFRVHGVPERERAATSFTVSGGRPPTLGRPFSSRLEAPLFAESKASGSDRRDTQWDRQGGHHPISRLPTPPSCYYDSAFPAGQTGIGWGRYPSTSRGKTTIRLASGTRQRNGCPLLLSRKARAAASGDSFSFITTTTSPTGWMPACQLPVRIFSAKSSVDL